MRLNLSCVLAMLVLVFPGEAMASDGQPSFAIVSVRDRTADPAITGRIGMSLETALLQQGPVVERESVRTALRQRRIRQIAGTGAADLTQLASDLAVDWLVSVTIHEARAQPIPTITLSALAIRGADPQDSRSAFVSSTGVDGLHLLGLGEIWNTDQLAARELEHLIDRLALGSELDLVGTKAAGAGWPTALNRIAVLPLTSESAADASAAADAATQALHAVLRQRGADLVAPNRLAEVLRQQSARRWGELDAAVREAIFRECHVQLILTGSVEAYDAGLGSEPRPFVAISLRGLDAQTGRIVWTGALERDGWFRQTIFRGRRIYSRGDLLTTLLAKLMSDLADRASSLEIHGATQ
jgi:hypothetical protein